MTAFKDISSLFDQLGWHFRHSAGNRHHPDHEAHLSGLSGKVVDLDPRDPQFLARGKDVLTLIEQEAARAREAGSAWVVTVIEQVRPTINTLKQKLAVLIS